MEQLLRLEEPTRGVGLNTGLPSLDVHPLRDDLYNELHSRPFQLLISPAQITHIAVQHGGKLLEEEYAHLGALCDRFQTSAPSRTMPCYQQDFGLFSLRWERHLEFSSYTFIREGPLSGLPFDKNGADYVPREWLNDLPGLVVAALHLVVEEGEEREPPVERVADFFDKLRLVGSQPVDGKARVWTSFRLHDDGYGRILVYDRGLSDAQMGRLVQRLLELETYRLMATLGLPIARQINAKLNGLETQLKELTARIAAADSDSRDRDLLAQLSSLAARVEAFRAQSNYRFAATNAYYDVVQQRLEVLREDEVSGHMTLREFLVRRLTPAVKTCQTVAARLEDISRRVARVSDLLRTRVEMAVQEQNQELLTSMNRRATLQLRLQQTVEGLSVAAISYYMVSLIKLLAGTLYDLGIPIPKDTVTAASIPLVVGLVWYGTRRLHQHIHRLEKGGEA